MEKLLFKSIYDSESICDIFRDVSECFQKDFNPFAIEINENSSFKVEFTLNNNNCVDILLKKNYDNNSIVDIEEDITYSLNSINVEKDEYGFFKGDLVILIYILE